MSKTFEYDFITYEDMAKLFIEAEEAEFVSDVEDYDACNSECNSCPARPACLTLSLNKTDTESSSETYYDYVLPIIRELKNGKS